MATDAPALYPPPVPLPTPAWTSPSLHFRGRIFHPEDGYTPRSLLELRIRAGVGAILNKREWWIKWKQDGGAIRDKWFAEFERELLVQTLASSTGEWSAWSLGEAVLDKLNDFPVQGSDAEKQAFVDGVCATIQFNLIWHDDWWEDWGEEDGGSARPSKRPQESPEAFQEGNASMESYGQVTWYFDLVLLNKVVRETPVSEWNPQHMFELASESSVARATEFLLAVHRGEVTKETFCAFVPEGDHRPMIMDALWVHVDRIMLELIEIRQCMTKTLEKVIENNRLGADQVTEFISPGPVQETWMSDLMIKADLRRKFVGEVTVLEEVPEDEKDWHPNSDNQVLDLLHPSLYCCVFDETMEVSESTNAEDAGDDSIVERMQRLSFAGSQLVENDYRDTAQYQWIPSDFSVDLCGDVKILSYINNLHPLKHREMYDSIASIFKEFVPMFNRVLSCLQNTDSPQPTIQIPNLDDRETHVIPPHPPIPELLRLHPPGTPFTLRGKKVQVIVKIAEIHLTPENPTYPGGSWHVEGSDAEQLVATGIYYFECENITESRLAFRVIVNEPEYQQNDNLGMAAIYGLLGDELLVQNLGAVTAIENRCVVFPNTLQHRVEPFELADKTKPGVRKILAFFIVDPSKQIPSTAVIPPQQADWLEEFQTPTLKQLQNRWMLPEVVVENNVKALLGSGMTLAEAKEHRLKLMEERRVANEEEDDYELFFSLCEH